jgi:hypothetical protein
MMDDETVTPVVNDVVKPSLESVGRARRHDRAVKIEQGRRYGGWEGVGQVAFVVRRLVEQRDVILSAPAGAPCVVDRPEINMPAIGQTNLMYATVDRDARHRLQRVRDILHQWRHQRIGRRKHPGSPA